ncbi:DUF3530 family protein [Maribrevibacterium harenarium]|uniref:DUF3530 family protein n=1 Tax=Maribrevibacterium harenarium TaxID=2589817 RepID=A0A501X386_9GAMM|nr:DUF3530 family protein [Maribrevibacterium harenarium]TPE54952.1 DUF3530 family protein [Maribrevibacterium harenarium]
MKKLLVSATVTLVLNSITYAAEDGTGGAHVQPTPQQTRIAGLVERLGLNYAHEIETIEANGESFLGLFNESASGDPQGCVLMLHGDHGHPDWPQVISPLRRKLPQHSWCTLSIEIPDIEDRAAPVLPGRETPQADNNPIVAANGNSSTLPHEEMVFARIDASLNLIRSKGYQQAAYLGYRSGAAYMLKYAASKGLAGQALVLIDINTIEPVSEFDLSQQIESLRLPVLDYYFNMSPQTQRFADYRQAAANKRPNRSEAYTQIDALPDRRFDPTGDKRLTQRVWGFLKQNTIQDKQRKDLPEFNKQLFYKSSTIQ